VKNFLYHKPTTLSEALSLRARYGQSAVLLAGGSDVVIQLREHLIAPEAVIDIKGIAELTGVVWDEHNLWIGAKTTMRELAEHPEVLRAYPFLADAASRVGSKQLRNRATCVGNIVNASPLCDTGTPLYALDAVVVTNAREIPICEFITFVRRTSLAADEIVTGIRVPHQNCKGEFTKISRRSEVDLSTVCATVLQAGDSYRLSFGAVAPTPLRLRETEALLNGKPLTAARIEQAAISARAEVKPISDIRASLEYRLDMVELITRRSLTNLMNGGSEA